MNPVDNLEPTQRSHTVSRQDEASDIDLLVVGRPAAREAESPSSANRNGFKTTSAPQGSLRDDEVRIEAARPVPPRDRFETIEQWEGTVLRVMKERIVAKLRDVRDPKGSLKRAIIRMEAISDHDRPLASPGAVFYWSVGHRVDTSGQRSLQSTIRFRRVPTWSSTELKRLQLASRALDGFFREGS